MHIMDVLVRATYPPSDCLTYKIFNFPAPVIILYNNIIVLDYIFFKRVFFPCPIGSEQYVRRFRDGRHNIRHAIFYNARTAQ